MTDTRRLILLVPLTLGLALLPALVAWDAPPEAATGHAVAVDRPAWTGVGSCSAFACHGGNTPDGDLRSAYSTWMARDPHSRAGSVLFGTLSADIETALSGRSGRTPRHAASDPLCLGCHAPEALSPEPLALRQEGVGCESCHGPASRWIGPHTSPSWKSLTLEQKSARGMSPTKDLAARAVLCASCHVGGPGRDVDHDLIASGHPRLNFELLSYLDALPKHWDSARERDASPAFEARAWALGQAACARETLGVLAARTRGPVWPEFAEYSCSACHHDLAAGLGSSDLGLPPWGTWYFTMARLLPGPSGGANPLGRLRNLMDGLTPDPAEVGRLAVEARASLDRWVSTPLDPDAARRLLTRFIEEGPGQGHLGDDQAVQLTLAASAMARSLERDGRPPTPAMRSALEKMIHAVGPPFSGDEFRRAFDRFRPSH